VQFSLRYPKFVSCQDCEYPERCEKCPKPIPSYKNSLALSVYNQIQLTRSLPYPGGLFSQPKALMDRIMIIDSEIKAEQARKEEELARRERALHRQNPLRGRP